MFLLNVFFFLEFVDFIAKSVRSMLYSLGTYAIIIWLIQLENKLWWYRSIFPIYQGVCNAHIKKREDVFNVHSEGDSSLCGLAHVKLLGSEFLYVKLLGSEFSLHNLPSIFLWTL